MGTIKMQKMEKVKEILENGIEKFKEYLYNVRNDKKTLFMSIAVILVAGLIIFSKARLYFNHNASGTESKIKEGVLTPLTESPNDDTFYVQANGTIYETCLGTSNFTDIAKEASRDRIKWYTTDDSQIPTIYKDDIILYYTSENIPTSFVWERFEDLGYTVGICDLVANEAGKYQFQIQDKETIDKYVNGSSSANQYFSETTERTSYIIDKIDATKVSSENVSNGGTITGLTYGQSYTVDLYEGANYVPAEMIADTHAFSSFEIYESAKYGLMQEGYVSVAIPDSMISGYYTINNGGIFRYVNNTREEGITGVDFNQAYYLGVAEDGTIITLDNKTDYASKEDLTESDDCYRYNLYLDDTNALLDVDVTFNDTINFVKNQNADNPIQIVLISPDNVEYKLLESERKDNTFTTSLVNPDVGNWCLKVYNTGDKFFEVNEVLTSNQSDYVNQTGNTKAKMKIDLETAAQTGLFRFVWENTSRAAEILIIAPDGSKYGKSINEGDVISETYGEMLIQIPNAKEGTYSIEIQGEDLGKVRFYNDSNVTTPDESESITQE